MWQLVSISRPPALLIRSGIIQSISCSVFILYNIWVVLHLSENYHVVGNFWGNFYKFWGFVAICESFLCKFGPLTANNPWKFSPRKSYFTTIYKNFPSRKFPAIWYGVYGGTCHEQADSQCLVEAIKAKTAPLVYMIIAFVSVYYCISDQKLHMWPISACSSCACVCAHIVHAYEYKLVCIERIMIPACFTLVAMSLLSTKTCLMSWGETGQWKAAGIKPSTLLW